MITRRIGRPFHVMWQHGRRVLLFLLKGAGIVLFLFVAASLPFFWELGKVKWHERHPIAFDRPTWDRAYENLKDKRYVRLKMAAKLKNDRVLLGKSKSEVIAQLGGNEKEAPHSRLLYWLSPLFVDSMWLRLEFDAQDRVIEVRIVSD